MPNKPTISVVMSVYNGEKYLREAVDSIIGQTFTDFEFVIINDGSTDNFTSIMREYGDKRIRIIENAENIGLTRSLNRAIKEARGEYLARQDADDISLPHRFEEQIKYFSQHPETALLGSSIYVIDESGKVLGLCAAPAEPGKRMAKGNPFSHGSTMFKRGIVQKLGGYNELFKYCQDYELWLRIAKNNEVRNLTQSLYKLRLHEDSIQYRMKEEAVLYHLLARRLVKDDLDANALTAVNIEGIKSLYPYLSRSEKTLVRRAVAYMYLCKNDLKLAREEYWKVLKLNPLDFRNNINLISSYLGKGVRKTLHRFESGFRHF